MNLDFISTAFNKLFDKTESLSKRFFLFIAIIGLIFVLDNNFNFSNNYVLSNKINNLKVIESIKKDIIPNYQAPQEIQIKINDLEDRLFEESNWFKKKISYLMKLSNGTIKFDFYLFISIQWLWIFFGIVILSQTIKKGRQALGELFGLILFIVVMMLLWQFLFPIIQSIFPIYERVSAIIFNICLNILTLIGLTILGLKKK